MSAVPHSTARGIQLRAFGAMCERDAWVTVRYENIAFLAQALLQPLFFLFVFGRVLPSIGQSAPNYGEQLIPGVVALTLFLTALQNTALPLVIEFSFTKEIEDRLLAPLPAWAVGAQKIVFAACRGIIAAILVLPLAAVIIPGGLDLSDFKPIGFMLLLIFGGLSGACVGMVLGTSVPPNRINVVFALVLTPITFTGATFYPWQSLGDLPWFQYLTLFNPLTYVSEGMRDTLAGLDHLATQWIILGIAGSIVIFGYFGLRGFMKRAVD